ncbi:pyridoxal phosphate-dependent aminotransferase [Aureimonas leprariae]|uniref:Pyridoxal phosphate-dependent aminotransferase n=1 Tax=Plantimonas leprariae TaxID=2615207 RepID=A0A7V7PPQ0_9HYPH|nr:pyridoxal phosphate-dependent aminotransferase [Aureimonas leprariae]KAB0679917.1 pyridoxal phosphate-dependent aminotransferase [Aureimonas leprariae]
MTGGQIRAAGRAEPEEAVLFSPLARSLAATTPFVGPEAIERETGVRFRARLGANESVFGPSPAVLEAVAEAAARSWAYGDPEQHDLKVALARHLGLAPANVTVGEGIDGLFGHLVHLATQPGDAVLTSFGAYPTFNYHVAGHGAALHTVPYRDDREDIDALLERARALKPKLLYFANPDNPTGSWHEAAAVERLVRETPAETILVLDEAYSDLAPASSLPPTSLLRPNLLRFRTFSKAYGMAGVRVGYAFGESEAVRQFDKVRNHFGVSRMAQAGAVAALADRAFLEDAIARIVAARDRLSAIARDAGLRPLSSATNFVAIDCGRDGAFAKAVLDGVIRRGVFIRKPAVPPLDRLIRVTVGREEELALFAEVLGETLRELG